MTYTASDRHGTYYFRRIIPPALRPFMPPPWTGKTEWKASLGTKLPAEAKRAAARCLADCTADFDAAERSRRGEAPASRPPLLGTINLDDVERDVLAALLGDDDGIRSDGDERKRLQTPEERAGWPDLVPVEFGRKGMAEEFHHAYGAELEELEAEYRSALSRSDPRIVDAETRTYLKQHGVPIDPTSEAYRQAGLAILRAHRRAHGLMLERQRGEVVTTPAPSAADKGPKVSEAYAAWKAGSGTRGSKRPSERTLQEAAHAVARLQEWLGDVRLGTITREQTRGFRDALAAVPARLPEKVRRLSIRELLKRKDLGAYPPVHAATVNKSLNILGAIVSHAEAAGKLDAVPGFRNFFRGVKLAVDARAEEERQPFSTADLQAIFGTGVYTAGDRPRGGGGEAAYWLPLAALLSGARLGELVQLRIADLMQDPETGVWCLDIGTAGGRNIKTASSRRKVPLHPELDRAGLLDYRRSLVEAGAGESAPLWPHVQSEADGQLGAPWSKWFNRHLRDKAGVEDRAKVFHSFRHTFKRMARDAHLPEEVHDALTGHAGGGVGRSYGKGFGLKTLAEAIARLEAPAVVRGLRWSPAERKGGR